MKSKKTQLGQHDANCERHIYYAGGIRCQFSFGLLAILVLLSLLAVIPSVASQISITEQGLIYAILSGSVASGVGYSLWYYVVKKLNTVVASIAQLSVPVIATLGGVLLLSEPVTMQFVISSTVILLGISLVLVAPKIKK